MDFIWIYLFKMMIYLSDLSWTDDWTERGVQRPEMIAWTWSIKFVKSRHRWRRGKSVVAFTRKVRLNCVRGYRERERESLWRTCESVECWWGWCSCSSRSSDWPGSERRESRSGPRRDWNKPQMSPHFTLHHRKARPLICCVTDRVNQGWNI